MKYKGKEIGNEIPSLDLIQEVISESNLAVCAQFVHDFWAKKKFLTKKGEPVKTLEAYVNVPNGIFVNRMRKAVEVKTSNKFSQEAIKWLEKNFDYFQGCMYAIKNDCPAEWAKYYQRCIELK